MEPIENEMKPDNVLEVPQFMKNPETLAVESFNQCIVDAKKAESPAVEMLGIVYGPRQAAYGESINNHDRIATIANAISPLDTKNAYTAEDVALIMMAVKLSRMQVKHYRDNYVDLMGYTDILYRIRERDQEEKKFTEAVTGA